VRIWDVEQGETLATLKGHTYDVTSVAWSPDGTRLASASGDGTVGVRSNRYLHPPCQWFLTNLTLGEWRQYFGDLTPYRPTCLNLPSPELPSPWDSLKTLYEFWPTSNNRPLGGLGNTYIFVSYQGWAVVVGLSLLMLGVTGGLVWLAFRLVQYIFRKLRGRIRIGNKYAR
jgi:WD40 repeat protein